MADERWRKDGVFFFQCPKAAGNSVGPLIGSCFTGEERCGNIENDVPDHEKHKSRLALFRGYKWYAGHVGRDVYEAVRDRHVPITNFRWPPDRVFSLYTFFRYNVAIDEGLLPLPHLYALKVAKQQSFEEFALSDDPRITVYTHNQHFRQLSASAWDLRTPTDLRPALDVLYEMPWFFVLERQNACAAWLKEAMGLEIGAFAKENATRLPAEDMERHRAGFKACYDAIVAYNRYDIALYYAALARMDTLFKA